MACAYPYAVQIEAMVTTPVPGAALVATPRAVTNGMSGMLGASREPLKPQERRGGSLPRTWFCVPMGRPLRRAKHRDLPNLQTKRPPSALLSGCGRHFKAGWLLCCLFGGFDESAHTVGK